MRFSRSARPICHDYYFKWICDGTEDTLFNIVKKRTWPLVLCDCVPHSYTIFTCFRLIWRTAKNTQQQRNNVAHIRDLLLNTLWLCPKSPHTRYTVTV